MSAEMIGRWRADLRLAWRALRGSPAFACGAVLILALGIGVNVAVFTVADGALFRGYAGVGGQDRIAYVTTGRDCCISYQDLLDWRASTTAFTSLAAVADLRAAVDAGAGSQTATATEVTANTFALLGVSPAIGRDFTADDDRPGAARVTIVSDRFWRRRLDAGPDAVGRTIRVNGIVTTVIGVMPASFAFPQNQELWLPLGPRVTGEPRSARGLWFAVGRLAAGVTIVQAQAELDGIGRQLAVAYPDTNTSIQPRVQSFRELFLGPDAVLIFGALWVAVGVLLAIACANITNLVLAHSAGRTRQFGIQLALGAGRSRIVRQQLIQSVLLALGGGALGWGIAILLVRAYRSVSVPPTQPWAAQLIDYSVDGRVVAYLVTLSVLAGLLAGLLPARRLSSLDVLSAVRDGGRGTIGDRGRRHTAWAIVAAQVALAVVLLSGAGVLVRSVLAVQGRYLGYDPARILVTLTMLPAARYPDVAAQFAFYERAASRVNSLPGVEAVAFSDAGVGAARVSVDIEGPVVSNPAERPQVRSLAVSPGYFRALGTGVIDGRDLDDRDGTAERPTVIVNRPFAMRYYGRADAIGRRVRLASGASPGPWLTIVGIAPDLQHGDRLRAEIEPAIYVPLRLRPARGVWLLARTTQSPPTQATAVRREIQDVDPDVPIWLGPFGLEDWQAGSYWRRGLNSGLFTFFAALAVLLAGTGLFAVVAGAVSQRTQEIGVRMALGAGASEVRWLVVRQGAMPALIGLAAGLLLSVATNQLLRSQLVDVAATDPLSLVLAALAILALTLVGCLLPARRATRIDPLTAIRMD